MTNRIIHYCIIEVNLFYKSVKNKSILRKLIRAGNEIIMNGYDEQTETTELLEKAEKSLF